MFLLVSLTRGSLCLFAPIKMRTKSVWCGVNASHADAFSCFPLTHTEWTQHICLCYRRFSQMCPKWKGYSSNRYILISANTRSLYCPCWFLLLSLSELQIPQSSVAFVCFEQRWSNNHFHPHLQAIINCTVTPSMTFTKTSQKFGQWADSRANTVYGLGFATEQQLHQVNDTKVRPTC